MIMRKLITAAILTAIGKMVMDRLEGMKNSERCECKCKDS
jgi:hypothetical protein